MVSCGVVTCNNKRKDCDQDVSFGVVLFQIAESSLQHNVSPAIFPRASRALYIIVSTNVIKLKLCLHLCQHIGCRAIPDQIDHSSVPPVSTITEGKLYVSASS